MNSKGPRRTFRRTAGAASGGVGVVIALLLLMFLRGGDSGDKDSNAEDNGMSDILVQNSIDSRRTDARNVDTPGLSENERRSVSTGVLVVLIDEHNYLVRTVEEGSGVFRPIELPRLIEVAQHARGDSNGIRVRIEKKTTARASAEHGLRLGLKQAGIGEDAVFESSQLLE